MSGSRSNKMCDDVTSVVLGFFNYQDRCKLASVSKMFSCVHEGYKKQYSSLRMLSVEDLCAKAEKDKEVALFILTSDLYKRLGEYAPQEQDWLSKNAISAEADLQSFRKYTGEDLLRVAVAHVSTAKLVLSKEALKSRLSDAQCELLKDKINAPRNSNVPGVIGF